MSIFFLKP
jgi:hypothetical protein